MELSKKVLSIIESGQITKWDMAIKLGISRVTLDTRLQKGNWKKSELHLLKSLL